MNTEQVSVGYTIFNKAHLLPEIIKGIKECFSEADEIIFLFDNCTDNSWEVCKQEVKKQIPHFNVKRWKPVGELFEIKANNYILEHAQNEVIILFQDDMICKDKKLKEKINFLIYYYGNNLGLIGCRDGFELKSTEFPEKPIDKVSSWSHTNGESGLFKDVFLERTFVNRGPLVFTKRLLKEVGYLDEAYYPQWCDDTDYCARTKFEYKKKNIVLQADIESKLEWGATRKKGTPLANLTHGKHMKKNWNLFISRYSDCLK